jgi:hypothetical protein
VSAIGADRDRHHLAGDGHLLGEPQAAVLLVEPDDVDVAALRVRDEDDRVDGWDGDSRGGGAPDHDDAGGD